MFISFSSFSTPDWVNNPPKNEGYIIGIGIGEDVSKAKQSAIIDVANTLYANVSSNIAIVAKTSNDQGSYNTSSISKLESEDVLLPNMVWSNIIADDDVYYAMAKVNKHEIVSLYEQFLSVELIQFDNLLNKSKISLNDYLFLLANQKKLELAAKRASAISSLSEKAIIHHENIEVLFAKINNFNGSVCFYVKESRDRMADKIYLPAIESSIQSNRFELKNSKQCIPVKFRTKVNKVKSSSVIVKVSMQMDIGQPATINKLIKFEGKDDYSYKSAMMDSADNFVNYFSDNGGLLYNLIDENKQSIIIYNK